MPRLPQAAWLGQRPERVELVCAQGDLDLDPGFALPQLCRQQALLVELAQANLDALAAGHVALFDPLAGAAPDLVRGPVEQELTLDLSGHRQKPNRRRSPGRPRAIA